jgi:hypothetical protein
MAIGFETGTKKFSYSPTMLRLESKQVILPSQSPIKPIVRGGFCVNPA